VPRATEFRSGPSGSAMLRHCEPPDNPAHRRIVAQALGVVHVLISSKAAEHRLPQFAYANNPAIPIPQAQGSFQSLISPLFFNFAWKINL
jgi:hypothetical protein